MKFLQLTKEQELKYLQTKNEGFGYMYCPRDKEHYCYNPDNECYLCDRNLSIGCQ